MRKAVTILCTLAFMVSGIMLAVTSNEQNVSTGYKSMSASTLPQIYIPTSVPEIKDTGTLDLSEDLVRDLAKRKGILDTVYITKCDTVEKEITKWRKTPASKPIMEINVTSSHRTDTIQVPVYYLATQVGNKEGPTGECISVYEVHKVDEICPGTTISSVEGSTEYHIDVGE